MKPLMRIYYYSLQIHEAHTLSYEINLDIAEKLSSKSRATFSAGKLNKYLTIWLKTLCLIVCLTIG